MDGVNVGNELDYVHGVQSGGQQQHEDEADAEHGEKSASSNVLFIREVLIIFTLHVIYELPKDVQRFKDPKSHIRKDETEVYHGDGLLRFRFIRREASFQVMQSRVARQVAFKLHRVGEAHEHGDGGGKEQ